MSNTPNKFKVVDLKPELNSVVIELSEGRMMTVPLKEGVEVKKHQLVALDKPEIDEDGVPGKDAVVGKVVE